MLLGTFISGSQAVAGRGVARQHCVRVSAAQVPPPVQWNIHGRHVTVDATLEQLVKQKLAPALDLLKGAEFLEGEGGVHDVDVRLMNSQVELKMRPLLRNKELHDTYLRQGELKVIETGTELPTILDKAADSLAKKLKRITKPAPDKKDYSKMF